MDYMTDDWPALPPLSALTNRAHCMDALDLLRLLPDNSIDAIVTDPPAGIAFMGKEWDRDKGGRSAWVAWMSDIAREALRVLKPGGHALVWAIPRTSHWTGMAWEDAGFQPRDKIYHIFGSGFPKSLDVGKAIDREAGAEREVVGRYSDNGRKVPKHQNTHAAWEGDAMVDITAPATTAARQWNGWGTALKPAVEEWWLFRKPVAGTVAANVQAWGTGALNVDKCRVEASGDVMRRANNVTIGGNGKYSGGKAYVTGSTNGKRFPANVIHDGSDEVTRLFPVTGGNGSGPTPANTERTNANSQIYGFATYKDMHKSGAHFGDTGSAARFFYTAKASQEERNAGVEDNNSHPTVKPIALMRYLCRLITPPGGIVLDMFAGSGTTGLAAREEGFRFILCDLSPEYVAIARARLAQPYTLPMFDSAA